MTRNNFLTFFNIFPPVFKYQISGHSMSPTLHHGQIIFVNRLSYLFKKPKVNEIVAAKVGKNVFIKRITKIEGSMFYLRGDNSSDSFDSETFGLVSREQIIGKMLY